MNVIIGERSVLGPISKQASNHGHFNQTNSLLESSAKQTLIFKYFKRESFVLHRLNISFNPIGQPNLNILLKKLIILGGC
jgi:hypothetical protein